MREVLGAVIATALVLIAVFVPVAFFPGTTGRLYAQFSMTIAFAVALSAFNALTLTPALSALLLDRDEPSARAGSSRSFERVITAGTNVYVARAAAACMRVRWAVVVVFVGALGADVVGLPHGAAGVRARGGPGLLHHRRCRRRPARRCEYTGDDRAAGRADPDEGSRRARRLLGHGLQLQRRGAEPGAHVRPR